MAIIYTQQEKNIIKILKAFHRKNGVYPFISQIVVMDNDFNSKQMIEKHAKRLIRHDVIDALNGRRSKQLSLK